MSPKARSKSSRSTSRRRNTQDEDPLYLQVARTLKKEIVDGTFPVGSLLPTEDDLCRRFSVSRYTVREALRRLRDDHLVASRQGAGTIVVPRQSPGAYAQDVMSINDLVSWAAGRRFVIESMQMMEIDAELAARSGLARGQQWLVVRGYGHAEGADCPFCWAEYFIHQDYAAVGRLLPRHSGPIFPLIEDLFGQSVVEVHQEFGATLMPPALAQGLKVAAGTAALEVRRSYKTSDGQIAQVTVSIHPAARFRHSTTLRRVKG
ncbi:MAG TPA: GntR family transcriptional regulator [Povalibacter sp.]|uniref:GntR family transcriptional regulator n=1 Tax=Povalibacter sp. TaxID=1962978 RepID=UPI002CFC5619|nr:GntR family transcriptional regulator [Povalibacter sp.]HMN43627.1 GntR family transcriptional regulator [Povalibacter sp.]